MRFTTWFGGVFTMAFTAAMGLTACGSSSSSGAGGGGSDAVTSSSSSVTASSSGDTSSSSTGDTTATTGTGGTGGAGSTSTSGSGGATSTTGTGGAAGTGGATSASSSSSSSTTGAGAGTGGSAACSPLGLGAFAYYDVDIIESVLNNIGGSATDYLDVGLFHSGDAVTGTFDLSGDNANYSTCEQCLLVYQDYDNTSGAAAKYFLPVSGSLAITTTDADDGALSAGTLTNVKLVEVTIDFTTFESTVVSGGGCYTIDTASWSVTSM